MSYRFIFFIIFCCITSSSESLRDGIFFKGADERVIIALGERADKYYHLLPSRRKMLKDRTQFFRFLGNFVEKKDSYPKCPIHHQAALKEHTYAHPGDPCAALLQTLFPSLNGVTLVPNQAAIDPVGQMTMGQVGRILAAIHKFKESSSAAHKELEEALHEILSIKDSLLKKMPSFLQWELTPREVKPGNLRRNTQALRRIRFFHILMAAIEYQQGEVFGKTMYTENILESSLVTFAWAKARSVEEMNQFYRAVIGIPDFVLPVERYTKKEYEALCEDLTAAPDIVEAVTSMCSERATVVFQGDRFFDPRVFITDQRYRSIRYRAKSYSNCVETAIYNFVINMARCLSLEGEIILQRDVFPKDSPVYKFFQTYSTVDALSSSVAIQQWSDDLMVGKQGISYVQQYLGAPKKNYEMYPGFINIYNMIAQLLGWDMISGGKEAEVQLMDAFTTLASFFSRADRELKVDFGEGLTYSPIRGDFLGAVSFIRDDIPFFTWEASSNHSIVLSNTEVLSCIGWKSRLHERVMPGEWHFGSWSENAEEVGYLRPTMTGESYRKKLSIFPFSLFERMAYSLEKPEYLWLLRMLPKDSGFSGLASLADYRQDSCIEAGVTTFITNLLHPDLGSRYYPVILSIASWAHNLQDEEMFGKLAATAPVLQRHSQLAGPAGKHFLTNFVKRIPSVLLRRTEATDYWNSSGVQIPQGISNSGEPLALLFDRNHWYKGFSFLRRVYVADFEIYTQEFYNLLRRHRVFSLLNKGEVSVTLGKDVEVDDFFIENLGRETSVHFRDPADIKEITVQAMRERGVVNIFTGFSSDFSLEGTPGEKKMFFSSYVHAIHLLVTNGFINNHEFLVDDIEEWPYEDIKGLLRIFREQYVDHRVVDFSGVVVAGDDEDAFKKIDKELSQEAASL